MEDPRPSPPSGTAGFRRAALFSAVLALTSLGGIATAQSRGKDFTPTDVQEITTTLRSYEPGIYLIRLPVYRDGQVIGQQLYGSLPMKDVELLAESLRVRLDPNANIIAVFDPNDGGDESGGGGGCGQGGGPGSHINTASAAWDLVQRLEVLLADIDASKYQFLR